MLETQSYLGIAQIAADCGLDNLGHFSQSFKKRFGKTPTEYTNQQAQKEQ
ncbi:MAG: AraC family transcriptional regulator [Cytophagales bacterium]|nr:AraC family transcriptional regulator [Cytophagales bacterium]